MNVNWRISIFAIVVVLIGGALLYRVADRAYFSPRAEIVSSLETATETVNRYRSALENRPRLHQRLRSYVDRTLGGDIETVDHRLRTRLNRIAEQIELQSISVTTGTPRALGTPGRGDFSGTAMRSLREELDFIEVPGSITAEGTLAQAIELVDRIEAEPWLKQVHDVNLDPRDNGQRFMVRVRLRTAFLPGQPPEIEPRSPYDPDRMVRLSSLTQGNPFRLPPPPEPERETRVVERPSPPAFPYDQWVLTGVAEGSGGGEVWLRNRRSGESRRITVGEGVAQVVLVAARGEFAEFERDDERFLVAVGSSLNDKTPLNR